MNIRKTAGGVIVGNENKVVVVSQHGQSWSLPKGGVDPGESIEDAAKREIQEETGLTNLELIEDLGTYQRQSIPLSEGAKDPNEIKEITMFLFRTNETELVPEDPDNPEALWVEIGKVAELLTHTKDKEFFETSIPTIDKLIGL